MDFEHKNQNSYEPRETSEPRQQSDAAANTPPQEGQSSTPYQTPVRASDEAPRITQQPEQPEPAQQPFHQGSESYSTYQQWQQQEQQRAKGRTKKPRSRKPFYVIGGIAAAVLLFAGGLAVGRSGHNGADTPPQTLVSDPSLPSLNISSAPQGLVGSADDGLAGEEIYAKVNPSIVAIQVASLTSQSSASGSGVIMSSDGYIITNAHVVTDENTGEPMDKVTVLLSDGTQLPAQIIGADEQTDLAVLKVTPESPLTPADFGDSDQLQVGQNAYAIGSPGGVQLANSMTSGIISAINRDITVNDRVMTLIQTNVTINPGNSGGALINKYGQVVGITSAKLGIGAYEGLGFAIPINSAKEIVDQLIQFGYVSGRPSIGITGRNISEQWAQYNDVPVGVLVDSVDSRANAASEGLQSGDIITAVDGTKIQTMDEINTIKGDKKAGETLRLTVYRVSTGKTIDLTITLTDTHDLEGVDPATQRNTDRTQDEYNSRNDYYNNPFNYFFGW